MRTITVTDEQFARLQAIAQLYHRTPEQLLLDWLDALPQPTNTGAGSRSFAVPTDEYNRRWEAFVQLVGSIQHGEPLTNEEIDELIGEEAAQPHDAGPTSAGDHSATDQPA